MAELNPVIVPTYNPDNAILTQTRPVEGIVKYNLVIPSDTVDLPEFARWLKCGTTGTIALMRWDGQIISDTGPYVAGVWHPVFFKRILVTGTTATQLMWGN